MEFTETSQNESSEIKIKPNESSSVYIRVSGRLIGSEAPFCWSVKRQGYFTSMYLWIVYLNGEIGCQECKDEPILYCMQNKGVI